MDHLLEEKIREKKQALAAAVETPLNELAGSCAQIWPEADAIDHVLKESISRIPACHLLYAWDVHGVEVSSLVGSRFVDPRWRGNDLSRRPYLTNRLPYMGIMLSSVYESMHTRKLCITALQAVNRNNDLLGFISADFAVADLLKDATLVAPRWDWRQYRGDPAVRGTVFMQQRVPSVMDAHLPQVHELLRNLFCDHGIFHCKIHYSSSRFSLWLLDDPYSYRIHGVDEIVDPDICLAYPMRAYHPDAKINPGQLTPVFEELAALRFADETIYLRSASINIMNGMLGLTFSCDGSHFMPAAEFLEKDLSFWLGSFSS